MDTMKTLVERLQSQGADFELIRHDKPIKSKKDALSYFRIEETVPTLIVRTGAAFYAVMISGEREKVDFSRIETLLGCGKIEMADKREVVDRLGLTPGQIPLVGHDLPCIMDGRIFNYQYVYGGSGDLFHTLKIAPRDLEKANNVVLKFD